MQELWRTIRRHVQRLRYRMNPPALFVHDGGPAIVMPDVPLDPRRAEKILGSLAAEGLVFSSNVDEARPASFANIRRAHTDRYLDSLADPSVLGGIFGTTVPPQDVDTILEASRRMVGGTIQATRRALRDRKVAVHLGGGLHHASPDRGMGFCVLNDIAVAILRLRAHGFGAPVLVVDLDIHDGNGTRAAFAEDATVHTFSIHNIPWDDAPAVASVAIALGSDIEDATYLDTLTAELPPIVTQHKPALVLYLAGTDPAFDDKIGDWRISPEGMLARDQFVVETLRRCAPHAALAVVLGGGYGPNAWRYSARFLAWLMTGRVREPHEAGDVLLRRAVQLGKTLRDPELMRKAGENDWGLSAGDLPGAGGTPRDARVLDHYTRHGVELIFERTGILTDLRNHGFENPSVDLSSGEGATPTIRVFGDDARTQLLIELRITRNARVIPGREILYIEWLLLQNPAAQFTEARQRLPGQDHPGLGLLGHVTSLLIAMAEALDLAGVGLVPANYYVAVLGQHHLRHLDPVEQGRFESLLGTLANLSLADASGALEAGRVRDAHTGKTVQWVPTTMVVPQGSVMRGLVESAGYTDAVREVRERFRFVLDGPGPQEGPS